MVLLDVSRLIWRRWAGRIPTGIDRVCLAYLEEFAHGSLAVVQRRGRIFVLDQGASQALFQLLRVPPRDFRHRFLRLAACLPWRLAKRENWEGALYLNLGHTGLDHPALGRWVGAHRLRAVYFVHDLIPLTHPEYCRAGEDERHARRMATVLSSGAGVIGNSQQTIDELARWADHTKRPLPPCVAALLGSDLAEPSATASREASSDDRSTFVTIGTIEGRKNHLLLLQAWVRMAQRLGEKTPRLLIVGQRGWESEQATDMLDRSPALRGHVEELGRCSDAELAAMLGEARALLFPSFAEGYGLPLAEALGKGTPVIASDLPVFREIGGDIPDYLDPLDGPAWIDAILDYAARDSESRRAQVDRVRGYRAPTWSDHFAAVRPWLNQFEAA